MLFTPSPAIRVMVVAPALIAWGLEKLLESVPTRMQSAGSVGHVGACLGALSHTTPDVLLLDLDGPDEPETITQLQQCSPARVLALTGSRDTSLADRAVLAGARGAVHKRETPPLLLQAIEKVHAGQVWVDREATGRIFMELARQQGQLRQRHEHQERIETLTRRERQTLSALLASPQAPGKRVAATLHITENTLRNHLTAIYAKLGVASRTELHAYGMRHGLDRAA